MTIETLKQNVKKLSVKSLRNALNMAALNVMGVKVEHRQDVFDRAEVMISELTFRVGNRKCHSETAHAVRMHRAEFDTLKLSHQLDLRLRCPASVR